MASEVQNITGLVGLLGMLEQLPAEIASKNGGPVRKAVRAGSVVILKEVKQNLAHVEAQDASKPYHAVLTRALEAALGTVKARDPKSTMGGASEGYIVKARKASKVKNLTPAQYLRDLEYGDERQTAKPIMGPAYYTRRQEALDTIIEKLNTGIEKAIQKTAAAQNWSL